ncbi:MAG TPA: protein phosphatase 2C domain-containing protein [Actinocrinis sp.]|jgi:protein phosphatase
MSLSLRYAARSHVGLIRDGNEDSGYAGPRLLVVADGMGGQAAGEVASSVVVQTMAQLDAPLVAQQADPVHALADKINEAHGRLHAIISENPQLEGMGTTLTAFLFVNGHVAFAHIGDSRAYRLRGGRLEQLTADHTWVQRLVDEGRISEQEAGHHPQRSLLMRALDGRGQAAEPDFSVTDVQAGDRFMLCSDGLSSFVSFDTLESALAGYADPHQSAETLIQLALRAGGPDNVTCIVADAVEDPGGDMSDASTQFIEMPVTVGAAAEHRGTGLPTFSTTAQTQPIPLPESGSGQLGPGEPDQQARPDDFPADTPAGRAARLRRSDRRGDGVPPDGQGLDAAGLEQDPARRRRWIKPTVITAVIVVVVGALFGGGYVWSQRQYYVADDDGLVAIYQGMNYSVLGVKLSHVYSTSPKLEISTLPTSSRQKIEATISADGLADARTIVATYATLSDKCRAVQTQPTSRPSSSSSPAPSTDATSIPPGNGNPVRPVGSQLSASPSASPSPSATSTHGAGQLASECSGAAQEQSTGSS